MSDAPRLPHLVEEGSAARDIGERFARPGFETWLVGGYVRDRLLGRPAPDVDVATDAKPTQMLEILRGWAEPLWLQGIRFGTVGAMVDGHRVEITTYREEWYSEDSRKPEVHFAPDVTSDL